ncbi:SET and MYND domain-containing protein 4 [Varanus komodoensis]|uniref:SET and MYND domain-containing protein 4 n=1 Tax=Varanus komodoensis TaxID=61221 RepID=UPI001CF7CA6B|nr:SET and MYND domain-containing protein 4 [Varanus komodoensis]XP_044286544.1 SET and MYND domain-containing protein 4 [Varanus komodoensis]
MDLPVEKWKVYVSQKWTSLEPSLKEKLLCPTSLKDNFLAFLTLLQPEDEEYLLSLSRYYSVKKDPALALSCKEAGNEMFRKKEYRTAAVLYSRALSHTETGSPEMAICYANRSAALFHLGQFEDSLEDIRWAEEEGYPDRLYTKILLRKAECLLSLGKFKEAADALSFVENKMSVDQSLKATGHQLLLSKLNQLKVKAGKENSSSVCRPAVPGQAQRPLEPWEKSDRIPCASPSVCLSFSTRKGRQLVAAREILPGEILVREEAFVSVLHPGESFLLRGSAEAVLCWQLASKDLHCHRCLKGALALVPCQGCSYAKYCSPGCARLAWESYHRKECPLGGLLLALGVFCHASLRAVLVADCAELSALVAQSREEGTVEPGAEAHAPRAATERAPAPIPGCDADGRYCSAYKAAFSLLTHTEKHSPEFRFLCGLSVAALCRRLGDVGLEASIPGKDMSEDQEEPSAALVPPALSVLGEAMLRHMLQLQCNAQAVTVLRASGSEDKLVASSEQVRLATAIFPVVSLLNHSCDPNTSVTFSCSTAEVRALQPIARGQEILHCYGPHRRRMGAAERRRRLLAQYFFECRCPACLEELRPGFGNRASPAQGCLFRCPDCRMPMQEEGGLLRCSSGACEALVPEDDVQHQLRDLKQRTETALELLEHGEPGQSVELLQKCRLDAKRFLSPAHLAMGEIEDRLAQAYVTMGKWPEAAGHVRRSVQAVEAHYGPSSIEAGQELFKLAQILFNGRAVSEALHTIRKAEAILSTHLGSRSSQVQELQEMKACLEELLGASTAAAAKMA